MRARKFANRLYEAEDLKKRICIGIQDVRLKAAVAGFVVKAADPHIEDFADRSQ